MTRWTVAAGRWVLLAVVVASRARAQSHPDFSGKWASEAPPPIPPARDVAAQRGTPPPLVADIGSGWGRAIAIAQDARALVVEWPYFTTYDLQPPLRFAYALDGAETVNTAMVGRGEQRSRARASWSGSSLVITTSFAPSGGAPESTIQQTLTLTSPTTLVVETTRHGPSDVTTRTTYTKDGGR